MTGPNDDLTPRKHQRLSRSGAILDALRARGPLTMRSLCHVLDCGYTDIDHLVRALRHEQRVTIIGTSSEGRANSPIYALPGQAAPPRPKIGKPHQPSRSGVVALPREAPVDRPLQRDPLAHMRLAMAGPR